MASIPDGEVEEPSREADGDLDLEIPDKKRSKSRDPITHPGTVLINVQGAFIVDDAPQTPIAVPQQEIVQQTHDIRLPNHTAIVSHIAVDASSHKRFSLQTTDG